jgi:predicted phosphodiesterase
MRTAFISDIHANLEALEAVLEDIDKQKVDEIICLGDTVGYGPDPKAVLARVRGHPLIKRAVYGNHDEAMWSEHRRKTFNQIAYDSANWTIDQLSADELAYLQSLPLMGRLEKAEFDATYCHASPESPGDFLYVDDHNSKSAFESMEPGQLHFMGHTHIVALHISYHGDDDPKSFGRELEVGFIMSRQAYAKLMVNVGSVGQPRDACTDACYVIYDATTSEVKAHRVKYDIAATQAKIKRAGYDDTQLLFKRLAQGA